MVDGAESLLTPLQRERRDLGYLTRGPTFGVNFLTELHGPADEDGLGAAPKVTLYAQPAEPSKGIDLAELPKWLDPNARRYEPAPGLPFVPPYQRGIVDGVLAAPHEEHGRRFDRFLAVRRSASAEYGVYCSWSHQNGDRTFWLLHEKLVILQFGQFLRFLDELATLFDLPKSWTVWCNARDLKQAVLVGFGEGWLTPFDFFGHTRATFCLEEQFQLEFSFSGGPEAVVGLIDDLARRFELAFGSTTPRAYDRAGTSVGSINYSGIRYQ